MPISFLKKKESTTISITADSMTLDVKLEFTSMKMNVDTKLKEVAKLKILMLTPQKVYDLNVSFKEYTEVLSKVERFINNLDLNNMSLDSFLSLEVNQEL